MRDLGASNVMARSMIMGGVAKETRISGIRMEPGKSLFTVASWPAPLENFHKHEILPVANCREIAEAVADDVQSGFGIHLASQAFHVGRRETGISDKR